MEVPVAEYFTKNTCLNSNIPGIVNYLGTDIVSSRTTLQHIQFIDKIKSKHFS